MIFEWTSLNNVTSDIVDKFDCGEETFNDFLKEQAKTWMSEGYLALSSLISIFHLMKRKKSILRIVHH